MSQIITRFVCPPIRCRQTDWSAVMRDYEPGDLMGYGPTEAAAVADLREQMCAGCPDPVACWEAETCRIFGGAR